MKFIILSLLLVAFCWSAEARSVCFDGLGQNPNLVDIQVNSGKLNQVENAFVRVYGINGKYGPTLPVTPDQLIGVTYVEYNTKAAKNTKAPTWGDDFPFPRDTFNEETIIAIELWNQDPSFPSSEIYLGGALFTIADLQTYDKEFQQKMVDRQDNSVGQLDVTWTNGKC